MENLRNYFWENKRNILLYTLVFLIIICASLFLISKSNKYTGENVGSNVIRVDKEHQGYIFAGEKYNLKVPTTWKLLKLDGYPDNPFIPIYEYQKENIFITLSDNTIKIPTEFSKTNKCNLTSNEFKDDSITLNAKLFNNITPQYLTTECQNGNFPHIQLNTIDTKDNIKNGMVINIEGTKESLLSAKPDIESFINSANY